MTLHGDLSVNAQTLGGWTAQRLEPITQPDPDTVCRYRWSQWRRSDDLAGIDTVTGEVTHRYGDGPELLGALVLANAAIARNLTALEDALGIEWLCDGDQHEPVCQGYGCPCTCHVRAAMRAEIVEQLRSLIAAVTPPTSDTDQGARVGLISALYAIDPDADLTPAVTE